MKTKLLQRMVLGLLVIASPELLAVETWQSALAKMPLRTNVVELHKTNCVPLLLDSFRENKTAKALIFMPGATDELYFFDRVEAKLTNRSPTLLDALIALTNQTLIQVTFRAPFVLVHSPEDPLEPHFKIEDEPTAENVRRKQFVRHGVYNDRDWDFVMPILSRQLGVQFLPEKDSMDSWHFYRHSLAAWNLNGWEALEAISLAGKTTFIVQKGKIIFEGDRRFRARPPVPVFPK